MKKIIISVFMFTLLFGCKRKESNQPDPNHEVTTEVETYNKIKTNDFEIINLIRSKNTPTGISIVTLADGKKFIYCENGSSVAICQIFENTQQPINNTIVTPTN